MKTTYFEAFETSRGVNTWGFKLNMSNLPRLTALDFSDGVSLPCPQGCMRNRLSLVDTLKLNTYSALVQYKEHGLQIGTGTL